MKTKFEDIIDTYVEFKGTYFPFVDFFVKVNSKNFQIKETAFSSIEEYTDGTIEIWYDFYESYISFNREKIKRIISKDNVFLIILPDKEITISYVIDHDAYDKCFEKAYGCIERDWSVLE